GGALRVGPRSAGARPGPACYGAGGTDPTVTDANLLLGYLAGDSALAGGLKLDREAAETSVAALAAELELETLPTAAGIVEIANLEMLRATTATTIARGVDPRDHALVAFGGAGPMHAAAIADALGISTVICPASCGVFSAYGMALAGRRRDRSRSLVLPLGQLKAADLAVHENALIAAATADLGDPADASVVTTWELRYSGQSFELPVTVPGPASPESLARRFHDEHAARYLFADRDAAVELVTVRVSVTTGRADAPAGAVNPVATSQSVRDAWFDGRLHPTVVTNGTPSAQSLAGPAVIELSQSTIVVPPGWTARSAGGDTILDRRATGIGTNDA
ncbi:MAG: hydantoinase/oxoprolinase family protein, partial [Solirubrobacterales bacterium]